MMKKSILLTFVLVYFASAVDIDVKIEPYVKNEENIAAFNQYLKTEKHFTADSQKGLDKHLHDDWLLANHFAKDMSSYEKALLTNMVNRYLARKEIEKIQKSIKLSNDVLKSYYLDNLKDYKLKPLVDLTVFNFKTLEDAHTFYKYSQEHNYTQTSEFAKEQEVKQFEYKYPLNKMMPIFRLSLRDLKQTGYFTPPLFYGKEFLVIYVKDIKQRDGYLSFKKVKGHIGTILHKQTYLQKRNELISIYQEEK